MEGVWVVEATDANCSIDVPTFTCKADSNLGSAIVTDPQLCDAATPAEQCPPLSDLEGVWVVDATAEVCNIAFTPTTYQNEGTADTTGIALSSIANCEDDDVVTGGGFTKAGASTVETSRMTTDGTGWNVTGVGVGSGISLKAFVVCQNSPLGP